MVKYNHKTAQTNTKTDLNDLLIGELDFFGIVPVENSNYQIEVGDETILVENLKEAKSIIKDAIKELKTYLYSKWEDLKHLILVILENTTGNQSSLNNIIFLNGARKLFYLSKRFPELKGIHSLIKELMNTDVSETHPNLINKFNIKYFEIKTIHQLILNEIYKSKLISRMSQLQKEAQISGPWANVDLPMKERVWEWDADGDEEYFADRTKSRKQQPRYNPETNKQGFYFVWQDLNLSPYSFEDRDHESPYKGNNYLSIP